MLIGESAVVRRTLGIPIFLHHTLSDNCVVFLVTLNVCPDDGTSQIPPQPISRRPDRTVSMSSGHTFFPLSLWATCNLFFAQLDFSSLRM